MRFSISLAMAAALILSACAAPPVLRPDHIPETKGLLSLEEILESSRHETLKAVLSLDMDANSKHLLEEAPGVVYLKSPDSARLRIYRFGMPIFDVAYRDGEIKTNPEQDLAGFQQVIPLVIDAVFWWSRMDGAVLQVRDDQYVIRARNQIVELDRKTLLPVSQTLWRGIHSASVVYSEPGLYDSEKVYPSRMDINSSIYSLAVTIRKMSFDIPLEQDIFESP